MEATNAKQIAANIEKAAHVDIPLALTKGLENACLLIERSAKANAPVRSGNLRSSITHRVTPMALEGVVGSTIDYAPYVEIGTGVYSSMGGGRKGGWFYVDAEGNGHWTEGSHPQPFLKPAMDNNISAIMKCFEGLI